MSAENVYLLAFAAVLFVLNALLGGPIAAGIANFFARFSSQGTRSSPAPPETAGRESTPGAPVARVSAFTPQARLEPGTTDPPAVQDRPRPRASQLGRSLLGP